MLPSFAIVGLIAFAICVQGDTATDPSASTTMIPINVGYNSTGSGSGDDGYGGYDAVGVAYCKLQSINTRNNITNARMIDPCNYECLYEYSIYYNFDDDEDEDDFPFKRSINPDERSAGRQRRSVDMQRRSVDMRKRSVDMQKRSVDMQKRSVDMQKRSADQPRPVRSDVPIRPKREANKVRRYGPMRPGQGYLNNNSNRKMNISLLNLESCGSNSQVCYSGMCIQPSAALQTICDSMGAGSIAISMPNSSPCSGSCVVKGINSTYPSAQNSAQLPMGMACNTSPDMKCSTDGLCLNATRFVNKCM